LNNSSPEHEPHPNVVIEREFPFDNIDISIANNNNGRKRTLRTLDQKASKAEIFTEENSR